MDGTRKLLVDLKKGNPDVKGKKLAVLRHDMSMISLAQDDASPAFFKDP